MGLFSSVSKAFKKVTKPVSNVVNKVTPWNDKSEGVIPIAHLTPWNDKTEGLLGIGKLTPWNSDISNPLSVVSDAAALAALAAGAYYGGTELGKSLGLLGGSTPAEATAASSPLTGISSANGYYFAVPQATGGGGLFSNMSPFTKLMLGLGAVNTVGGFLGNYLQAKAQKDTSKQELDWEKEKYYNEHSYQGSFGNDNNIHELSYKVNSRIQQDPDYARGYFSVASKFVPQANNLFENYFINRNQKLFEV